MDISDFIGAAKTFHVLGIKVTKDGELINECLFCNEELHILCSWFCCPGGIIVLG